MTEDRPLHHVAHPVWAAWRIDLQYGHGLVAGWVRDEAEPWQWHPLVAGAGRGGAPAGTPSTYPKGLQKGLVVPGGGFLMPVVVELYPDQGTARTRADQLHREYTDEFARQADAEARAQFESGENTPLT